MKSKRLMKAIGGIDDKFIQAAQPLQKDIRLTTSSKKSIRVQKYLFTAASLVIIASLSAVFIRNSSWLKHPDNNGTAHTSDITSDNSGGQSSTNSSHVADSTMYGLPVENFSLSDIQDDSISMDRIVFMSFGSIFKYEVDNFAVIKVDDIRTVKNDEDGLFDHQISDVRILQSVYGDNHSENMQISQNIIKDHFCLGTTNLLRKGGVYILPLVQADNTWYINGDMDVLFEVDDQGKVWSHSGFDEFSQHDGDDIDTFICQLQKLTSDQDFLLANSKLGNILDSWTLSDITVTEKSSKLSDEFGQYFNYAFTVNDILSDNGLHGIDKSSIPDNITVYADDSDQINLVPGGRYLIFLDINEGKTYVNPRMISKINNDMEIEVIPASDSNSFLGESVFTPYDGYSISEIHELISRIGSWNQSHPSQP